MDLFAFTVAMFMVLTDHPGWAFFTLLLACGYIK